MPNKTTVKMVDRKTGKPSKNFDYVGGPANFKSKAERQKSGGETAYRTHSSKGNLLFPKTVNENIKKSMKVTSTGRRALAYGNNKKGP